MSKKNNNNWQELEREEKHYKDDRSSKGDRIKRPYKRDRSQGKWWEDAIDDPEYEDEGDH